MHAAANGAGEVVCAFDAHNHNASLGSAGTHGLHVLEGLVCACKVQLSAPDAAAASPIPVTLHSI